MRKHFEKNNKIVSANNSVIDELADDCPESEVEENINCLSEINEKRAEITTVMKQLLYDVTKQENDAKKSLSAPATEKPKPVKCQLERLKVQQFNGNVRDYPSWKLNFTHCMAKYCLDEDEQLQRLKEAILPPVHKEITHCLTIQSAYEILDQNYGNEDELMTLLLHDIKSCQPIKHSNFKSLKSFAAEICAFITRVKDLNKTCDLKAEYVLVDIMEKLPRDDQYKYKVYCWDKSIQKSLESLAAWITEEAQRRHFVTDDIKRSSSSTYAVSAELQNKESTTSKHYACLLGCNNSHMLKDCPIFKSKNVTERWNIVKANKCCFCSLKKGHFTLECNEKKRCSKENCMKNHNLLLHSDNHNGPPSVTPPISSSVSIACGYLPVVQVKIYDGFGVTHNAVAMLDSGSQQSLVRKAFANRLRLKGSQSQDLEIQLAGGGGHVERSRNYELKMSADDCSPIFNLSVMSLETVCGDITPIDKGVFTRYPHLVDVLSKIYQDGGKVDLLIGTNFPTAFKEAGSCYSTDQDAPIAKQTPLGWVLLGELSSDTSPTRYVNHVNVINEPNIDKMFEIDNLGVKPTHACTCNDNKLAESAFIEQFKKSVQFQPDGRLEMKMPWKEGHPSFPDNPWH